MDLRAKWNNGGWFDVRGTPSTDGGVFVGEWPNGKHEVTTEVELIDVSDEDAGRIIDGDPSVYGDLVSGPDAFGKIQFAAGAVTMRGFGFPVITEYKPYRGTSTETPSPDQVEAVSAEGFGQAE